MFWFGCWIKEIVSPTLHKKLFYVSLAVNWGVPKDIVSGIVTVQEVVKPHGLEMFSAITIQR